jgi:hypothetical protein
MYCPSCGKPLSGPSTCWFCGTVVGADEPTLAERPPTVTLVQPSRHAEVALPQLTAAEPFVRPVAITVLAVLHGIAAAFGLLGAMAYLAVVATGDAPAGLLIVALILGGIGGADLACGIGLWRLKPWGRALALGFAWVGLIAIPLGTLVSALVLYYLFRPGIRVIFSGVPVEALTEDDRALAAGAGRGSTVAIVAIVALAVVCVVIVAGIVAAIAIPGLMRAKAAASEAVAVGSLRTVVGGQAAFSATCGGAYYSPSLVLLGVPPTGGGSGFVTPDLAADPAVKSGYTLTLTPGPAVPGAPPSCNGAPAGTLVETYYVSAEPTGVPGGRHFGVNQDGTVYESTSAMAPVQRGAPPGAAPIR